MIYRELPWDSGFFGVSVGALTVEPGDKDNAVLSELAGLSCEVCYLFIPYPAAPELAEGLTALGAECFDRRTLFEKRLGEAVPENCPVRVEEALAETGDLVRLAVDSGRQSRFRLDWRLEPFQAVLYERWLRNCFESPSGKVWQIAGEKGCACAMLCASVKNGAGKIELVAVDESCRGRGYGKALLHRAEKFFIESGAVSAEVVTQLDNEGACRLYRSCGYETGKITEVWHLWKNQ